MSDDLREHYQALFRQHGDTAQAAQYFDAASQHNRFRVLYEFAADLESVVDLGCGPGHLCQYLRAHGFTGRYLGLDFVPEFVAHANRRHADDPAVEFREFNMRSDPYPEGYDSYFISGVFNNRLPDSEALLRATVAKAYAAARKGIAFNALSTYVDYQDADLYYADPKALFRYCKQSLTPKVTLRHDYRAREDRLPYEYAVYLYK